MQTSGFLMYEFLLPSGLVKGEPPSWYAIIHADGFAPEAYDGMPRRAKPGSPPRILILEPGGEYDAFVSRYDSSLAFIEDAWYSTREAAASDCSEAFGDDLGEWTPVPDHIDDVEGFVLRAVSSRS